MEEESYTNIDIENVSLFYGLVNFKDGMEYVKWRTNYIEKSILNWNLQSKWIKYF